MPCIPNQSATLNGYIIPTYFDGAIVAGSGTLSYVSGTGVWEVTPKPTPGTCTIRFTPQWRMFTSRVITAASLNAADNFGICDGVTGVMKFVGGDPTDLSLVDDMDVTVVGELEYIEVTYQDTVSSGTPWQFGNGLVQFERSTHLIVADESGNVLSRKPVTVDAFDFTLYNHDFVIDNSSGDWSGKIKVYFEAEPIGGGASYVFGVTDVTCSP